MNPGRCKQIAFCLAAGGLLALFRASSPATYTALATLFAFASGDSSSCAQTAPCKPSTALDRAGEGDTIYVAQGIYAETGHAVVTLTKNISLYGGWGGSLAAPVVRDLAAYPTTLDGEGVCRGWLILGRKVFDHFLTCLGSVAASVWMQTVRWLSQATVTIESVFAQTVNLSEYHISLTPLGDCALYVAAKTAQAFTVKAMEWSTAGLAAGPYTVLGSVRYESIVVSAIATVTGSGEENVYLPIIIKSTQP